jgi:hypothetical protein
MTEGTSMNEQPHHSQFQDCARPNWPQIKIDFEAGTLAVREIARREGVSDTAIGKRAKSESWDTGLRQPANQPLPGLQTTPQTEVQTTAHDVVEIVRAYAAAAQPPEPDDEFKWSTDNPDVLVWDRPAIAVYLNPMQQIVIREESRMGEDDAYIRVDRRDVPALIKRLEELSHGA